MLPDPGPYLHHSLQVDNWDYFLIFSHESIALLSKVRLHFTLWKPNAPRMPWLSPNYEIIVSLLEMTGIVTGSPDLCLQFDIYNRR